MVAQGVSPGAAGPQMSSPARGGRTLSYAPGGAGAGAASFPRAHALGDHLPPLGGWLFLLVPTLCVRTAISDAPRPFQTTQSVKELCSHAERRNEETL